MNDLKHEQPSDEALFRYHVMGAIRARLMTGGRAAQAIAQMAGQVLRDASGRLRRLSTRTLHRWWKALDKDGLAGLEPSARRRVADSTVLPPKLLTFCRVEKEIDPAASVPELLQRALARGVIARDLPVDRTSLWRALVRMGIPTSRARRNAERDMRAYAFPHRMLSVLVDGKHFRAGSARVRRVALAFLDDATRFGLRIMVGTAESALLFLSGLYGVIHEYGLMNLLYMDLGTGFTADDTHDVCARLGVPIVHGEKGYPQARGKVERFHRTFYRRALRSLDGHPAVDPDCGALTLRLNHALQEVYNHAPHEGLDGQTPFDCWQHDTRPLVPVPDPAWLRDRFRLRLRRRVTYDNTISYLGIDYELPRGHAGTWVTLVRSVLEPGTVDLPHEDRLVRLHEVDRHKNAYDPRHTATRADEPPPEGPPRETAAHLRFEQSFRPLVGPDGGYPEVHEDDQHSSPTKESDHDDDDHEA